MTMTQTQSTLGKLYAPLPDLKVQTSRGVLSHKVEARDEPRKLIEIDVFPSNGMAIGGQHVHQGVHNVVIYASELEAIQKRVCSAEQVADWKDAERTYASALSRYLENACGKAPSANTDAWPVKYRESRERATQMFGDTTVSLEFSRRHPLGRPPITKLSVIEDLPAPLTSENRERSRFENLIERLVDGVTARASQAQNQNRKG